MSKYPFKSFHADALYTTHERSLFGGNPWIEALPNIPDDRELYESLAEKIPYDETERTLPYYIRKESVHSLTQLLIPLSQNGEIARKVYSAIREGYVNRNPLSHSMKDTATQLQKCVITRDSEFRSLSGSNANAYGFCLVGDSGLGKTTAVNKALNLFPQVITHREYNGLSFNHNQLVWLRLECPHDCSVKALTTNFFVQFDQIMNDNTFYRYAAGGRSSTDQMIPQMALIAQRHGLGLLVIDEIQNLSNAKSGGAEKMLSFLVQLVNTIGVPVLLVGTPNAVPFLASNLMTIRRSAGQQGMSKLHSLAVDSLDWQMLTKGLWKYQWTANRSPLTNEIKTVWHECCLGNIDLAVKLYMQAQRIAIDTEQYGGEGAIGIDELTAAAHGDEFADVIAYLHAQQQWELEKQAKQKKADTVSKATPTPQAIPHTPKKSPSKRSRTKQKASLSDLEAQGLIVQPDDEF